MKNINKINIIIFFSTIVCCGLSYFVLPKKTISLLEKRTLTSLPRFTLTSYLSGSWSDSIDMYLNDQSPLRNEMVRVASHIKYSMGIHIANQERIVEVKRPKKNTNKLAPKSDSINSKNYFIDDIEESYSGSMLIVNGSVFTLNYGSPIMSKVFAAMVSKYAKELQGITRVFSAVPPLSSAFIPSEKYKKYNDKNQETLLAIGAALTNGAVFCDVLGELNKHRNRKLFFSTDHHWTPLGAYYGYVSFCNKAGFNPTPLEQMERKTKYNFLGTLYELTRDKSVQDNPDTMEYYIPNIQTSAISFGVADFKNPQKTSVFCNGCSGGNTYSTFLCGDLPLMKIKTSVKNGKKALVIKNSYGNAFSVFLISHYEEIYVMDFRYSEHNILNLIRDNNINDLIFAVGMYGAMADGTIKRMHNLGFNNGLVKKKVVLPVDSLLNSEIKKNDTLNSEKKEIIKSE